jgi:glycoside/pentoside/hexuronide:cation symporter, GPH family
MAGDASYRPHRGALYGALGLPLAFVALPVYVLVPAHYATVYGVSLSALGMVLLLSRLLDALIDPALGRLTDQWLQNAGRQSRQAWWRISVTAGLCVLAFGALFMPPVAGEWALLWWCGLTVTLSTLAYSTCSIAHQAWGTRLGGDANTRARWVAWREGLSLVGVVLANVVAAQFGTTALVSSLAVTMLLAVLALRWAPWAVPAPSASGVYWPMSRWQTMALPWRDTAFRDLMLLFLVNGTASAVPATLVVFFIQDVVQRPDMTAAYLGLYFVAGALSVPLWVRLLGRMGPSRAWAMGMAGHVLTFAGVTLLGPGDVWAYGWVCAASGVMLGADLTAPGTLLNGVVQRSARPAEAGLFTGWWQMATKLNLALAAGLALPALQWLGYRTGVGDDASRQALVYLYGVVPCAFKLLAMFLWWRLWARKGRE